MIAIAVGILILASQPPTVPARANRIAFYEAEQKVERGWTKDQVSALLGQPDEVNLPGGHSPHWTRMEVWGYGARRPFGIAMLGQVGFDLQGRVILVDGTGEAPPPMATISDAELEEHLDKLEPRSDFGLWNANPSYYIRAANDLRSIGKDKALAVMLEFTRVEGREHEDMMFWLAKVLFAEQDPLHPTRPHGAVMFPSAPKDPSSWPDYPMLVVDDIPFLFVSAVGGIGRPWSFSHFVHEFSGGWTLRAADLRPPDDPFLSLPIAVDRAFARIKDSAPGFSVADECLSQTLAMLTPGNMPPARLESSAYSQPPIEKYHEAFLAAGGHWDATQQAYVGRDGKPLG